MSDHREHYRFREELVDRLRRDLLGPTGADSDSRETISDWPATAYALGVLFPRMRDADDLDAEARELDHDEADSTLTVEETPDTGVSLASVRKPSAVGLTFAVDPAVCGTVVITVTAAVYDPVDEAGVPTTAERAERRTTDEQDLYWRRRPLTLPPVQVDVTKLQQDPRLLAPGLELRVRVRRPSGPRGVAAVTTTVVNTHEIAVEQIQDTFCFFQTGIRIETGDGSNALVERPAPPSTDDEVILSRLLHRHAPNFATGHGCAADWQWQPPTPRNISPQDCAPAATSAVWSEFAPSHEVLLTDSNPDKDVTSSLGMRWLADADDTDVIQTLRGLTRAYDDWIAGRHLDASTLRTHHRADSGFARVLDQQLDLCDRARRRMDSGIDLLERDPQAMRAFRLANRAMATQRARTSWIKKNKDGEPVEDGTWRPFQIGFLLLCLDGVTDHHHPDRETADLLWFPTGGGKTEAYLGLIAYTTFLRRLRLGDRGAGVTVLMRYTLRLLTLQQFERASALICVMEKMRREEPEAFGTKPISIGMWVGKAATPNYLTTKQDKEKSAETGLRKLAEGTPLHEANPVQLRACSWCGTALDHHAYTVEAEDRRLAIRCPKTDCPFHRGLPVHLVDEAVYHHHPTLVIATADKFAQIAWRDQVAAIFNRDLDDTLPPELIVQDELHLISGPLGTLAGLYEAAIDLACDRPKIIASTATIRRAQDQGKALFDRPEVAQFPPAGIDARDSWFAVETLADKKASRRYVGLLAPGTSQATLLVRAYAALLHHAAVLDADTDVRDAYWTLVGYFNSLRLLAAAELQVRDDVNQRMKLLASNEGLLDCAREADRLTELTSRVASSRIPGKLKELETGLPHAAPDVVLATNMISVGVDVDRLGLMTVLGQPQTTAEYIQATSRVGRQHPGLVVTLFNSARSRDRSHYEGFVPYHSALYRQVESTSVTPFSPRARDRALHAAFIGLARLTIPDARPNTAAGSVKHYADQLVDLRDDLVTRAQNIDPLEAGHVAQELDWIIEDWCAYAADNPSLVYEAPRRRRPGQKREADTALLRAHNDDDLTEAIDTMWSFRDVDVESDLYLEA